MHATVKTNWSALFGHTGRRFADAGGSRAPAAPDCSQCLVAAVEREVRTPLSTLSAAAQMLSDELGPQHPGAGFARLIRQESERVQETLADLVAMGLPVTAEMRPFDLAPLLNQLADESLRSDAHACLRLEMPAQPLPVWSDPRAVLLVFRRIVQHQFAAMARGGELRLRVTASHAGIQVSFSDSAAAVPEELLGSVFEPFTVLPGRRPEMGLALCRRVVRHLNGAIAARNNAQGGLTIEIHLPSRS